jgi:Sushi repeat (SCR repeat)
LTFRLKSAANFTLTYTKGCSGLHFPSFSISSGFPFNLQIDNNWGTYLRYSVTLCHLSHSCVVFPDNRCDPVPVVINAVANTTSAERNSVVQYTCIEGFITPVSSVTMYVVCNGQQWTPSGFTGCQRTFSSILKTTLTCFDSNIAI